MGEVRGIRFQTHFRFAPLQSVPSLQRRGWETESRRWLKGLSHDFSIPSRQCRRLSKGRFTCPGEEVEEILLPSHKVGWASEQGKLKLGMCLRKDGM